VYHYKQLREANVYSTYELIELCSQGKSKRLMFTSSLSAVAPEGESFETDEIRLDNLTLTSGYGKQQQTQFSTLLIRYIVGQTKWVSERLVSAARECGLKASILRLPYISGDNETGYTNSSNFLWRFVKSCILLKTYPDLCYHLDMYPVDVLAKHVVQLCFHPEGLYFPVYHFVNSYR
jgi:L-aminoadipate-semialdehyde dehydrogenase